MTEGSGRTDTDHARLRLEGLEHLNRLLSGAATDRDAAALIAWRSESPAHQAAFRAAVRLREAVCAVEGRDGTAVRPEDGRGDTVIPFVQAARRGPVTRRRVLSGAIAASVAGGAIFTGRFLDLVPTPAEALAEYRTGPGERRLVGLANGASVDLNTRTSINVRHGAAMPTVELVSGEAVLNSWRAVAALLVGAGTAIAHGGRLNARRDGDAVCITCLAGAVDVRWNAQRRQLKPTDALRYDAKTIGAVERGVDAAALTAWQDGTLIFRNMPMAQVVAEINRYRSGRVFLANADLSRKTLSGTYHLSQLDDFFSQVQLVMGVSVVRLPGNVVVLS